MTEVRNRNKSVIYLFTKRFKWT